MARGNNGRPIVRTEEDRFLWYDKLATYVKQHHVLLHAHALMSNHFHLLAETPLGNISSFMRDFGTAYVCSFKKSHRHKGHLFQNRFKSPLVQKETYFLAVLKYIHLNPVKAGLVSDPAVYQWSSMGEYLGLIDERAPLFQNTSRELLGRKNFRRQFRTFHVGNPPELETNFFRGIEYYGEADFETAIRGFVDRRRRPERIDHLPISFDTFEKVLSSHMKDSIQNVLQRSRYSEADWRACIVTLAKEECLATYEDMGRRWNVKPSRLAVTFHRAKKKSEKQTEELIDSIRRELSNVKM